MPMINGTLWTEKEKQKLLVYRLNGCTYREAAAKIGRTREAVAGQTGRLRKKKFFEYDYRARHHDTGEGLRKGSPKTPEKFDPFNILCFDKWPSKVRMF